jgi:hypothetical protein
MKDWDWVWEGFAGIRVDKDYPDFSSGLDNPFLARQSAR